MLHLLFVHDCIGKNIVLVDDSLLERYLEFTV